MYPTFVLILHSGMFDTCLFPTVSVSPVLYTVSINREGNILELESITYSSLGALRQMSLQGAVFVSLDSFGDRVLVCIWSSIEILDVLIFGICFVTRGTFVAFDLVVVVFVRFPSKAIFCVMSMVICSASGCSYVHNINICLLSNTHSSSF